MLEAYGESSKINELLGLTSLGMSLRSNRLLVATIVLLASAFCASSTAGQNQPSRTALATFEMLHTAESAGANITSLVDQYNSLLQQSAPNSSFVDLGQAAETAQNTAVSLRSTDQTLTVVLVPVMALLLALAGEGLLQFRRRIIRTRMLEMEIEQR